MNFVCLYEATSYFKNFKIFEILIIDLFNIIEKKIFN